MRDVVVVGGGPTGCFAAYKCAKLGLDTVLLEKETYPRDKPCGGVTDLATVRRLGKDVLKVLEIKGKGNQLFYEYLPLAYLPSETYYFKRTRLDHYLATKAVGGGVELLEGCRVSGVKVTEDKAIVETSQGTITSRLVIGADGSNSVVGRSTGLTHDIDRMYVAMKSEIPLPRESLEKLTGAEGEMHGNTFFFKDLLGFAWIIPNRNSVNVGIGAVKRKSKGLKSKFKAFLSHFQLRADRVTGHLIPYEKLPKTYAPRVLLVGDAGGYINPWTGCGLNNGTLSADIAARAAIGVIEDDDYSEESMARYESLLAPVIRNLRFRALLISLMDDAMPERFIFPSFVPSIINFCSRFASDRRELDYGPRTTRSRFFLWPG